jgi:hypothetical protein
MSTSAFNEDITNPQYRDNYLQVTNEYFTIPNYFNYDNSSEYKRRKNIALGGSVMTPQPTPVATPVTTPATFRTPTQFTNDVMLRKALEEQKKIIEQQLAALPK